jgi:hypothetical protein
MAFEQRGVGHYYYRKVWRNGTCHSEYMGHGQIADLFATTDGIDRHQHTMARLQFDDFKQQQKGIDQAIDTYHERVRNLVGSVLQAAGFHQHKRQWRKARRMANELAAQKFDQAEFDEFIVLIRAAEKKSSTAADMKKCREYAQEHPALFDHFSMLANSTFSVVLDGTDMNETTRICVEGELHALRRQLGIKTATPMEKLLIEEVVICWLRLQLMEQIYSNNYKGSGVTLAKAEYLEKRLSATRRRYQQSIESLARTRSLLARAGVQINVAQQQVVMNG